MDDREREWDRLPWRERLAWCAALFDGEGSISFIKNKSGRNTAGVKVSIGQKDRFVLDRFTRVVGVGRVYGPHSCGRAYRQHLMFVFNTTRFETAQAVIAMIWRWLAPVKRAQISRALATAASQRLRQRVADEKCRRGHVRTPENTYVYPYKGKTWRQCRDCANEWRENVNRARPGAAKLRPTCKNGHPRIPENVRWYDHVDPGNGKTYRARACVLCARVKARLHAHKNRARRSQMVEALIGAA